MIRVDANIEDSQQLTVGEVYTLQVDFRELDGESFTISSGTVTFYDSDDAVVSSNLTSLTVTITTGNLSGEKRCQVTLSSAATSDLSEGYYYAVWDLTLSDGQTRKARQSIKVRTMP